MSDDRVPAADCTIDPDWLMRRARAAIALLDHEPQGIEDEHVMQGLEDMHDAAALAGEEAWQRALTAALEERLSHAARDQADR